MVKDIDYSLHLCINMSAERKKYKEMHIVYQKGTDRERDTLL